MAAIETTTVTAERGPCTIPGFGHGPFWYQDSRGYWQPTLLAEANQKMCEMEHWIASGAVTIAQDTRDVLDGLWSDITNLAGGAVRVGENAWKKVEDIGQGAIDMAKNQLAVVRNNVVSLWQWLKAQLPTVGKWLLIGGGILLGLFFLPEIVDATGAAWAIGTGKNRARHTKRKITGEE